MKSFIVIICNAFCSSGSTMKVLKALKFLVLAVSAFMFVYQCSTAVQKLQEKPILDRTEYIPIQNITKPIITICPQQNLNSTMLRYFGYGGDDIDVLYGSNMENESLYSWNGWNDSLSFRDIVTSSLAFDPNRDFWMEDGSDDFSLSKDVKQVYYAKEGFGLCFEIEGNFYKHLIR